MLFFQDALETSKANVSSHETYESAKSACEQWINEAVQLLDCHSDLSGCTMDNVQVKLTTVDELIQNKQDGQELFQCCNDLGQKLCSTTAADGREIIRLEIRQLRDKYV